MIDLKHFRTNPEYYITATGNKGFSVDFKRFQALDSERTVLQQQKEHYLAQRNSLSKEIQSLAKDSAEAQQKIEEVQSLKQKITELEESLTTVDQEFQALYLSIPNPANEDSPIGKDDSENVVISHHGEKPIFSFQPKPHRELLSEKNLLNQEHSAKISGSRFYFLYGDLVMLELALAQFALSILAKKGFTPTIVPHLVKEDAMIATGFFPADKNEIYTVNPGEDNLFLIGTSEVPMVAQHADMVYSREQLPLRFAGISQCYRREAGSYGKDTKGLIRVHQFAKVEMVSIVDPSTSIQEHALILSIEEEIFTTLDIHFRKIAICTGDLGTPAAKKYDLEARMPGLDKYVEITSCSNCTDFQARRAKIRYKDNTETHFVHTLNGTAISITRFIAVFIEQHQQADGTIRIPSALQPFLQNKKFIG